ADKGADKGADKVPRGRLKHFPSMTPEAAKLLREKLASWFIANGRALPWRANPLPYAVLVSEFMLQQTQVATVIPFFERWMEVFPDLQTLAVASESDVLRLWQGLGYYSRARNLHKAAQQVLERFEGKIPSDSRDLRSLPGVGEYTAGAIASFAYDRPAAAVDANIARVLARLANQQAQVDTTEGARLLLELAENLLPKGSGGRLHTSALMELGALVCLPKKPKCLVCPIRSDCRAVDPETLPRKSPRKATVFVEERAAWIATDSAVLLEQQVGNRSRGLWKFPVLLEPAPAGPLFETVYPFTHHKVTLRVYAGAVPEMLSASQRWFAKRSILDEAALPAGHRRALVALVGSDAASLEQGSSLEAGGI
ncbi:MAG: A/G-specific adenine glycosylase, partial [Verrucomicrobia bacterium]